MRDPLTREKGKIITYYKKCEYKLKNQLHKIAY